MTNNSYPKIYHIFAGDKCIAADVPAEEFDALWQTVRGMVGLMQTSYTLEDLRYEEWTDVPMSEIADPTAAKVADRIEKEKSRRRSEDQ
jgi:hypothetical protein